MTALHFASQNDRSDIIEILIKSGANLNVQNKVATYIVIIVRVCKKLLTCIYTVAN